MPADVTTEQLDALVAVADRHRVHGFILSNLTKKFDRPEVRQEEVAGIVHGGISGKPTFDQSNALIAWLYQKVADRYVIIGCGGVFSAEDAYEKIRQGATLIQLITGMIFEGPQLIGEINRGLAGLLRRDGFRTIREAVGSAHGSRVGGREENPQFLFRSHMNPNGIK
jgi:dihydroorotate dehydrogenase